MKPTGHAELFAGGDFAFYVELGGGIVSGENGGEAGAYALRGDSGDFLFQFDENLVANFYSVENLCRHGGRIAHGH